MGSVNTHKKNYFKLTSKMRLLKTINQTKIEITKKKAHLNPKLYLLMFAEKYEEDKKERKKKEERRNERFI